MNKDKIQYTKKFKFTKVKDLKTSLRFKIHLSTLNKLFPTFDFSSKKFESALIKSPKLPTPINISAITTAEWHAISALTKQRK